jgi:hypothetical protein
MIGVFALCPAQNRADQEIAFGDKSADKRYTFLVA